MKFKDGAEGSDERGVAASAGAETFSQEDTRLREQLRQAVRAEEAPPYLEARIEAHIRSAGSGTLAWKRRHWAAIAAVLMAVGIVMVSDRLGYLRLTGPSQAEYVAAISNRVASIMRVGLTDHLHCAFFHSYPKNPPAVERFVQDLGPEHAGLIPLVRQEVPGEYRMEIAHRCIVDGRKFVHLVLRGNDRLLSLIFTQKQPGESFETEGLRPTLARAGIPVYQSGVENFQIASFETRDHLVYFISDLPQDTNLKQMLALAPVVKEYLKKLEL